MTCIIALTCVYERINYRQGQSSTPGTHGNNTILKKSIEYQNNSEVIGEALWLHAIYRVKVIKDLRKEIDLGWDGPDSSKTMDQIIKMRDNE